MAKLAAAERAAQLAEQERMAEPQANAEHATVVESVPVTNADTATQKSAGAAAPMPVVLLRTVIVTGGWIAGWIGGLYLYDTPPLELES